MVLLVIMRLIVYTQLAIQLNHCDELFVNKHKMCEFYPTIARKSQRTSWTQYLEVISSCVPEAF